MESLSEDTFFQIFKQIDITDLAKVCSTNSKFNRFCKQYKDYIGHHYLRKYQVEYLDPTNFIYLVNRKDAANYIPEITGYGFYDVTTVNSDNRKIVREGLYFDIFKLYMKNFYYKDIVKFGSFQKITSFPVYPNMVKCNLSDNNLTSFPVQPKMTSCIIRNNKLSSFGTQPEMTECNLSNNKLTSFAIQPNMVTCNVSYNELTSFPVQPLMRTCDISHNKILKFPSQPRLVNLKSEGNNGIRIYSRGEDAVGEDAVGEAEGGAVGEAEGGAVGEDFDEDFGEDAVELDAVGAVGDRERRRQELDRQMEQLLEHRRIINEALLRIEQREQMRADAAKSKKFSLFNRFLRKRR